MASEANLETLDEILEAERDALLSGDLELLGTLLPAKETLIDSCRNVGKEKLGALRDLDHKLRRNQLLLDGALDGIRRVAERVAELRSIRSSLATYGSDGKKHNVEVTSQGSVERRA